MWTLLTVVTVIFVYFAIRILIDNAFTIRAKFGEVVYPEGDVRGIDISHYQDEINWDEVRNAEMGGVPLRFIIIKATQGEKIIDENFNENFAQAKKNGFIRGAYHYFEPKADPIRQARHFCKIAQLEEGDLVPVLDVEERGGLSNEELQKRVIKCLDFIEDHYGATPMLYASASFRTDHLGTPEFDRYPLWIAHYYVEHVTYKGEWSIWQHSDQGRIEGIKGPVDVNVFNGSYQEFEKLLMQ